MATRFTTRATALPQLSGIPHAGKLARQMTIHIAAAVVVYALVQLWLVIGAVAEGGSRFLPHIGVGLMLIAVVPAARRIERRWADLANSALASRELCQSYRHDAARVWAGAIILPFVWVGAFMGASAAAGVLN